MTAGFLSRRAVRNGLENLRFQLEEYPEVEEFSYCEEKHFLDSVFHVRVVAPLKYIRAIDSTFRDWAEQLG